MAEAKRTPSGDAFPGGLNLDTVIQAALVLGRLSRGETTKLLQVLPASPYCETFEVAIVVFDPDMGQVHMLFVSSNPEDALTRVAAFYNVATRAGVKSAATELRGSARCRKDGEADGLHGRVGKGLDGTPGE